MTLVSERSPPNRTKIYLDITNYFKISIVRNSMSHAFNVVFDLHVAH